MLKLMIERIGWAVAFTVVIAFFLPWLKSKTGGAEAPVRPERAVQELVEEAERPWFTSYFSLREREILDATTQPLQGTSGFGLLLLTRSDQITDQEKARRMVSFLGSIEPKPAAILIYAVPACALIAACFLTVVPRVRGLFFIPISLCLLIYLMMRVRLNETYFERLVLDLSAGLGLWISLYGLLAMMVLLLARYSLAWTKK
jgi:hypothetical protein